MSSEIDIAQQNEENPLGDSLFAQLVESIQKSVVKKVNNPDQSSNDGKPNQDSESDDGEIKESDNESDLEKLGHAKKAKKRKKDHKKHKKKDHKRDKGEKKSKKSSDKSKSWYDLGEYEPNSKSKSYVSEENAVKPSHRRRSASVSSAGSTSKIRRSKSRERDDSSRKRAKLSPPEVPRSKLVVKERSEERDNRLYSEHRSVSQARSPPRRTSNRERDSHRSENSYYRSSYDPYYREPRSDNRWYYKDRKSSTRSVSTCSRRTRTPRSVAEKIDKAKLLAIARENLAKMIKEGTLPKGSSGRQV
ncbi:hypothetical protein HDE_14238 [Halotydeus destructor]|nr:hypothetical protein HDE_14238 [Halotydeus destructor]